MKRIKLVFAYLWRLVVVVFVALAYAIAWLFVADATGNISMSFLIGRTHYDGGSVFAGASILLFVVVVTGVSFLLWRRNIRTTIKFWLANALLFMLAWFIVFLVLDAYPALDARLTLRRARNHPSTDNLVKEQHDRIAEMELENGVKLHFYGDPYFVSEYAVVHPCDNVSANYLPLLEKPSPEFHPFFGVWRLNVYVFSTETIDPTLYQDYGITIWRYALDHDIRDFIGYEIEFAPNFVRLGEMMLYDPVFDIRLNPKSDSILGWNRRVVSARFNGLKDVLDYLGAEQILMSVRIDYPNEPSIFWRGEFLDPFILQKPDSPTMTFNPLFEGFILLTDNYILFSGHGSFVLASRACL